MPNNNPEGVNGLNQWQGFGVETIPYGTKQAQDDLARSAPTAGQPAATSAVQTPRRDRKAAGRSQAAAQPAQAPAPASAQLPVLFQAIGQIPGVTPMWAQLPG